MHISDTSAAHQIDIPARIDGELARDVVSSGGNRLIPFHVPHVGEEEILAVSESLRNKQLTTGPSVAGLERKFAEYVGAPYAIAVNSCTSALRLALALAGLKPGAEVIVPTYTFTATAEVVLASAAKLVLCDSEFDAFNIDPEQVEALCTDRTEAVIPVHVGGVACDLGVIHAIAKRRGFHVIEDAAHALPTRSEYGMIGSVSEMTAFSFYSTKTLAVGEGGMLTLKSPEVAEKARLLINHGIGTASDRGACPWDYEVREIGFKMNLPELLGAVGLAQLNKADRLHSQRSAIAARYFAGLGSVVDIDLPPFRGKPSWHLFIIRLRAGIDRRRFMAKMLEYGVETGVHYKPLHLHPFYRSMGYREGDFPNAEDAHRRCVSLPIWPDMTTDQVDRVIDAVAKSLSS